MASYTVDYNGIQGHVYTLLLEGDSYYVGWSSAVETRIAQHFLGGGSKWTMLHKPVRVLACVSGDTTLENVITISLMCQYGWERVRGGSWCQLNLDGPPEPVNRAMKFQKPPPERCRPEPAAEGGALGTPQVNSDSELASPQRAQQYDASPGQDVKEVRESIMISRSKPDGEQCAWRAEIRSEHAAQVCAKRGFQCLYACTIQEITAKIERWRQAPEGPREDISQTPYGSLTLGADGAALLSPR